MLTDLTGQYFDLMELFRRNGSPSDKHWYLFNGDFVDRGSWSTEIALLLYAYKWLRPNAFFLNRGNHETDDMNRAYGFEGECKAKYNERLVCLKFFNPDTILMTMQNLQALLREFLRVTLGDTSWQGLPGPPWWSLLR